MNKLLKVLFVLFAVVVILVWWTYERMVAPSNELRDQLLEIIRTHDKSEIERLSVDKETAQFLLTTSSDEPISTADFQGGQLVRPGIVIGYMPAKIGTQNVDCYMVSSDTQSFWWIPHWRLVKISLKPIGIDPAWAG
jgi:hypothetical protein